MRVIITGGVLLAGIVPAWAGEGATKAETMVAEMFGAAPGPLKARIVQDETQAYCSQQQIQYRVPPNPDPVELAHAAIQARELASVVYPADGQVLGDWKRGEALAETGTGGQFTEAADAPRGGNCYACHQMAASELSYGTLGPSLMGYGKEHGLTAEAARAVYTKIYNSNASQACSKMPRFGAHGYLTVEQIRDLTAYVMAPDSPVNK